MDPEGDVSGRKVDICQQNWEEGGGWYSNKRQIGEWERSLETELLIWEDFMIGESQAFCVQQKREESSKQGWGEGVSAGWGGGD